MGVLLLAVTSCHPSTENPAASGFQFDSEALKQTVPIETIARQPQSDQVIYLRGSIGRTVPLLQGTVYELQDATGRIWVLSRNQVPKTGTEVLIRGIVRQEAIPAHLGAASIFIEQQ
jgi:uncharacterized protein YdeI (BOF family)